MKNLVIGTASFLVAILVVMTIYTIQGREARKEEAHDALSAAVESAVEELEYAQAYETNADLEAAFVENLMQQLGSASDVEVSILKSDHEKGLLSAEVTQTYSHPNGKQGKVSCQRVYLLDQKDESLVEKQQSYRVRFYLDRNLNEDDLYKTDILLKGQMAKTPENPKKDGHAFVEWRNAHTNAKADFSHGIYQEEVYYAAWREESE